MPGGRRDWRLAIQADAEAIADVYFASYRLLDFLPKLHDLTSYRWYVANVMLKEWTVTVAEDAAASSRLRSGGAMR